MCQRLTSFRKKSYNLCKFINVLPLIHVCSRLNQTLSFQMVGKWDLFGQNVLKNIREAINWRLKQNPALVSWFDNPSNSTVLLKAFLLFYFKMSGSPGFLTQQYYQMINPSKEIMKDTLTSFTLHILPIHPFFIRTRKCRSMFGSDVLNFEIFRRNLSLNVLINCSYKKKKVYIPMQRRIEFYSTM